MSYGSGISEPWMAKVPHAQGCAACGRFEGGIYDKFVFTPELQLAFKLNPRDFWEALIRADRELGAYLKNSFEFFKFRELPKVIHLNMKPRGKADNKFIRTVKEKLPNKDFISTEELVKACLNKLEVNATNCELRVFTEQFHKENGIQAANGTDALIPMKELDKVSARFLEEKYPLPDKNARVNYNLIKDKVDIGQNAEPIHKLSDEFEYKLMADLLAFHKEFPIFGKIVLSETFRSVESQAGILTNKLFTPIENNTRTELQKTYGSGTRKVLFDFLGNLALGKNAQPESFNFLLSGLIFKHFGTDYKKLSQSSAQAFFEELTLDSLKGEEQSLYKMRATSDHLRGNAVDISGRENHHDLKRALVEFLNRTKKYKIFLYLNNSPTYTAENGEYFLYGADRSVNENRKDKEEVFSNLKAQDGNWYFHVQ